MEFYSLINAQCEYNFSMMTMATTIAKESGHGMKNGWATDSNSCQSFQPLFKLKLTWCFDTILLRIHNFWWFNSIFHGWVWEYITYDVRVGDVHCAYNKIEDGTDREEKKNGKSNKMIYAVAAWEQIWMECIPFAVAYTSSNVIYRITCRPWAFDQEIHRKTNHLGAKTNQEWRKVSPNLIRSSLKFWCAAFFCLLIRIHGKNWCEHIQPFIYVTQLHTGQLRAY